MESGLLTKVINDFFTTVDGELSLAKGEFFLVCNFHAYSYRKQF